MKSLILLLCMFFDSGVEEKLVVVDHVDLIEVNHKYYHSYEKDIPQIKKQFIQVIFWEYRNNVLLPETKNGERTGSWYQGSDYVVIDYYTLLNDNYGLMKTTGISPYLYKGKWHTHYYDSDDRCHRVVVAKQMRITHTLYDPEQLNTRIVRNDLRKELTKPDRYVRIKKIPQEIIDLIDRPVEVNND